MHTVTMDAAVAVAVADSPALSASSSIDYSLSTTSLDDPTSSTFPPPGAPSSALFEVRETPLAGRGVFATQDIAAGTPLLTVEAPSADVILREYRRELCGWCFAYDRGREWKLRDNSVGFAFCGAECHERWRRHQGDEGVAAWSAVERLCKGRPREQEMGDAGTLVVFSLPLAQHQSLLSVIGLWLPVSLLMRPQTPLYPPSRR